jgi:hypothetical protein
MTPIANSRRAQGVAPAPARFRSRRPGWLTWSWLVLAAGVSTLVSCISPEKTVAPGIGSALRENSSTGPVPSVIGRTMGPPQGAASAAPEFRRAATADRMTREQQRPDAVAPVSQGVRGLSPLMGPVASTTASSRTDILWQNLTTGYRGLWIMNGITFVEWVSLGYVPPVWRIVCAADIAGDASPDLIWEHSQTGERAAWELNGVSFARYVGLPQVSPEWTIVACADIDGNGRADIFWTNTRTGERGVWLMNGIAITGWHSWGVIPQEWDLIGVADVSADGNADILWSNRVTGDRVTWRMNGTTFGSFYWWGQVPLAYTFVGASDVDGNGRNDMVWRGPDGRFAYWLLNGLTYLAYREGEIAPPEWTVAALTRFSLTPAGTPVTLAPLTNLSQTGNVGTVVASSPSVRVLDGLARPVAGVTVTFSVASGGGSVTGASVATDASGTATVGNWTLGVSAGVNTLTATVTGLTPITFSVTASVPAVALIQIVRGLDQVGEVSMPTDVRPAVRAVDAFGNPVRGVPFSALVTSGGGTIAAAAAVTGPTGEADFGNWVLGPVQGGNAVRFVTPGFTELVAVARSVPPSAFHIDLRYLNAEAQSYAPLFQDAIKRWRRAIIGDVPGTLVSVPAGTTCAGGILPAIAEFVDDVLVYAKVVDIDGPGGTLAGAGPCGSHWFSGLPYLGYIEFDRADLNRLLLTGNAQNTIAHEIGHVLGFGTSSRWYDLLVGRNSIDPVFSGPTSISAFNWINSLSGMPWSGFVVPVHNSGGIGTRDSHWREAVMDTELMTCCSNQLKAEPLSIVTLNAMYDLGYSASLYGYEAYSIPFPPFLVGGQAIIQPSTPWERVYSDSLSIDPKTGKVVPDDRRRRWLTPSRPPRPMRNPDMPTAVMQARRDP